MKRIIGPSREHKSHWIWVALLLLATLGQCVEAVKLRTSGSGLQNTAPEAKPLIEVDYTKEWNIKNIVGLAGAALVVIFLFLSFVFSDQFHRKMTKLKILQVNVVPRQGMSSVKEEGTTPALPLSVVIKLNSENPHHYVVPVDTVATELPSTAKCVFELDSEVFELVSFSVILREGHIPIHFGSVSGAKLLSKSQPVEGSKKARQIDLLQNTASGHEDEERLKGKSIILVYEISK